MKILSVKNVKLDNLMPVYDVVNANPHNNFLVQTNSGKKIVSHNCAMLDEVSFKEGASVNMEQSKIFTTYTGVLERMSSRFMVNGKIAGKMFLVSSKNTEFSFLENYIKKQQGKPGVLVCDAKVWDVKPTGTYSGKKFLLAIGGVNKPSKIVPPEEVEYLITFDDGRKVTYKYNDVVKLTNGKEKKVQDLLINDNILEQ